MWGLRCLLEGARLFLEILKMMLMANFLPINILVSFGAKWRSLLGERIKILLFLLSSKKLWGCYYWENFLIYNRWHRFISVRIKWVWRKSKEILRKRRNKLPKDGMNASYVYGEFKVKVFSI
jgi:hypothetical protein